MSHSRRWATAGLSRPSLSKPFRAPHSSGHPVIGDKAHRLLLDWYEAAAAANPPRDRRFRVIHAWYPGPREIARMGRLRLIADVTPNHLVRGLRSIDRSLGPERARTAHLTVAEAIAAYTSNPAYAAHEEDRKGTIAEGKLADLVVLSRDILGLGAEGIRATQVDMTVLGGTVIYRRTR